MIRQIILVGRALGAPTAERTLTDLATRLHRRTGVTVRPALLDHGDRSLHDVLDECHADNADQVLLLPVQVPRDRYLETWIGKAASHWREKAGNAGAPEVRIVVGVSETETVLDALVAAAESPSRPVTDSPVSFRSPNWSTIGGHRHHLLICRGPRCSAHGSPLVARALADHLQSGPVSYDDVLVTNTGCLVPCNLGPIIVVQPDDVWYTSVDPGAVDRIVDEHLHHGVVVDELRTTRGTASSDALNQPPAIVHTRPEDP